MLWGGFDSWALLQKRPRILRSLLIVATPYKSSRQRGTALVQHITSGDLAHAHIHTYIYELLAEKHRTSAAHNLRQLGSRIHTYIYIRVVDREALH